MAVDYLYRVYIPSLKRKIAFKEICVRDLININKSILNDDFQEIVNCFDIILKQCCAECVTLTLLDKIIALISIRSYSVSNFLQITLKNNLLDTETSHTLELNSLIERLQTLPILHTEQYVMNDIIINYGIPLYPIENGQLVNTWEYVHSIYQNEELLADASMKSELKQIVSALEFEFFQKVQTYATNLYEAFQLNPIYVIANPVDKTRALLEQRMSLDGKLYEFIKMLFNDNLHNLYRTIYNFSQKLNIQPSYTEGLIPVEKDVIWGYYIEDQKDQEQKGKTPQMGRSEFG